MDEAEHNRGLVDDDERRQVQDFKAGTRRSPLSNNVLMLLGELLQPATTGFDHVNLDMSFSFQDHFGAAYVKNSSFLISFFQMWGCKKAEYIERGILATHLNVSRSLNGKSMELFTTTVTQQKQEFHDKTDKRTGFGRFFGGGKSKEDRQ